MFVLMRCVAPMPRLMQRAMQRPGDRRGLVLGALRYSLRSPDREPPPLVKVSPPQEPVIRAFLRALSAGAAYAHEADAIEAAHREWWSDDPVFQPTAAAECALRRGEPTVLHEVGASGYRLVVLVGFAGYGPTDLLSAAPCRIVAREPAWRTCRAGYVAHWAVGRHHAGQGRA